MKYPCPAFPLILSLLIWPLLNPRSALAAPLVIVTPPSITFAPPNITSAPPSVKSIRIPLLPSTDNHLVFVYLIINGHKALPFLLDTGCSAALFIDDWASEELGIKKGDDFSIVEPGHQKCFFGDVQSVKIVAADAEQPFISINATSALCGKIAFLPKPKSGERCAGALGMPFFKNAVFTFDLSSSSLILYPDGILPKTNQKFITLPLLQPDTAEDRYFVRLGTEGQSQDYLLDTGAVNSSLPKLLLPDFLKSHQQTANFLAFYGNMSNASLMNSVLIKDFHLQTMSVPFACFNVADTFPVEPVLGMEILTHFIMTINVKNKTLTLIPRNIAPGGSAWELTGDNKEFLNRAVGFTLRSQKDKKLVNKLIKGSPAERGGVQENDEIVMLNGKALINDSVMDLTDAAGAITAPTDTTMLLTLLRDGKLLTRQVAISNDMDKTTYLPLGIRLLSLDQIFSLTVSVNQDFPLIVSAVFSGSAAAKAGLKVGDLVEGANGVRFEKKDWTAIQPLLAPVPGKRFVLEVGHRQVAVFPKLHWAKSDHLIINP